LTVTFPTALPGSGATSAGKYAVILTLAEASTTPAQVTTLTDDGNGNFASFVITAASGKNVFWMVVTQGHGA
jgi:hypothetical protein